MATKKDKAGSDAKGPKDRTGSPLEMLNRNTGLRLVDVAKLVLKDKNVPWFHRVPFYLGVVFGLLTLVLPVTFLTFKQPGYAFGALGVMSALFGNFPGRGVLDDLRFSATTFDGTIPA